MAESQETQQHIAADAAASVETGVPVDPPPGAETGSVIDGKYKLLQILGEGGMGTVFMAEQSQPVKRLVAVKVIKAGMDSKRVLARFEAERQALALMDHPHIAKVLDAGATPPSPPYQGGDRGVGSPYFVMEMVKGVPLTQFCDDRKLSIRDRLLLFQQVCQAVQHAHQKGIIHRDLKPGNLLVEPVDGKPTPKIIDFGLAKAMHNLPLSELSLFTQFGAIIGTPLYMAPEQTDASALDIDTRADIYALGVILYELLTGTTPLEKKRFTSASWDDIRRIIKEEEPPRPSMRLSAVEDPTAIAAQRQSEPHQLGKLLRNDLDWIVMKALAKERDRRYETANALAADVERFLRDEPVSAGPPSAGYRLRKFVKRHQGTVVAAALVLAVLVAGVIGTTWGLLAEAAQHQQAEQALAAETKARAQTRDALNAITDDIIEKLLVRQPQLGENERAFLRKVIGFYREFAAQPGDREESRAVAADGHLRVARVQAFLGEHTDATASYREAIRLYEGLVRDFPAEPKHRHDLGRGCNNLGMLLKDVGRLPDAEVHFRRASALFTQLAQEFPDRPEYRETLAKSQENLGNLFWTLGRRTQADTATRQAVDINQRLVEQFPKVPVYRLGLARSQTALGFQLWQMHKYSEAEAVYLRALTIEQELTAEFPAMPGYRTRLATTQDFLGKVLTDSGKIPEGEAAMRQAVAIMEKLVEEYPAAPDYRAQLAGCQYNLATVLGRRRKVGENETLLRQTLAAQEKLVASYPQALSYREKLAHNHNSLGALLRLHGKTAEAETHFRAALTLFEKLAQESPGLPYYRHSLAGFHFNLSIVRSTMKDEPGADAACRQALLLRSRLATEFPDMPEYRQELALSHSQLARRLSEMEKKEEADEHYLQALALLRQLVADCPEVPEFLLSLAAEEINVGHCLLRNKQYAEALVLFEKAAAYLETLPADNQRPVEARMLRSNSCYARASALYKLKRLTESREQFHQGLKLTEQLVAENPGVLAYQVYLAGDYVNYANALTHEDEPAQALPWYEKAIVLLENVRRREAQVDQAQHFLRQAFWSRSVALQKLGRFAEEAADRERAIQLTDNAKDKVILRDALRLALFRARNWAKAEPEYRAALEEQKQRAAQFPAEAKHRRDIVPLQFQLGAILLRTGKRTEGEAAFEAAVALREKLAAEFPNQREDAFSRALVYYDVAVEYRLLNRYADAAEWFRRSEPLWIAVHARWPGEDTKDMPAWALVRRGECLCRLRDYAAALAALDQGLPLLPLVEQPPYRLARALARAGTGDYQKAVAAVKELEANKQLRPIDGFDAARIYALSADATKDSELREQHAQKALALLKQTFADGVRRETLERMKKEEDLAFLRTREDFKQFLAKMEKEATN